MERKILVVDDDQELRENIGEILIDAGFAVTLAKNGEEALDLMDHHPFDVVLLDLIMPTMDGREALPLIKRRRPQAKVIMMTAFATIESAVSLMRKGADDYLTKPFNLAEFLLRVKGMLRRSSWYRPEPVEEGYQFGVNEVFLLSYRARTAQGEIDLTEMEVRVLSLFFQREGQVIPRGDLLESVWGYASDAETRTLDNFVVRLRKYFERDPSRPIHFQTVRGVGYRFSRTGG